MTLYNHFFNRFKDLDMDNAFQVQKLAINFKKWANWNKGQCTIEVLEAFRLNTIVVVHDLFTDTKIEDSWEFLNDVIYILEMYADNEENFKYMVDFWTNEVDL